jgi:hypothetical protein
VDNKSKARVIGMTSGGQPDIDLQALSFGLRPLGQGALRAVGRPDILTAQKVEVGIVFQSMLSTREAAQYLAANEVPIDVAVRVLTQAHLRRTR